MIPVQLLDVSAGHAVFDTCAAPGSKTSQILEKVASGDGAVPTGFVLANDMSTARANNLVHQLNRLSLPCFVVTSHVAQQFPTLALTENTRLMFDRILCDVPCSGVFGLLSFRLPSTSTDSSLKAMEPFARTAKSGRNGRPPTASVCIGCSSASVSVRSSC